MADRVQAVDRALALLEQIALSSVPLPTPELARRAGVNRATAWRLLNSLEHSNLIARDPHTGCYAISFGTLRLARAFDATALVRRARSVLERVATQSGGTAFLEVAMGGQLVVLDEARPPGPIAVDLANLEVPLHCGSIGKLYLASLPEDDLQAFLRQPLDRYTQSTITDPARLRAEVESARTSGLAFNVREHSEEWCGVTAAVRDRHGKDVAYINATLPAFRTTSADLKALGPMLLAAAADLAARLDLR